MRLAVIAISLASFLASCETPFSVPRNAEAEWGCLSLPADFSEDYLIGTWYHQGASVSRDELIIREDGLYMQIIEIGDSPLYEGPWNSWWIEKRQSGGTYVHFDRMHFTGSTDELIHFPEGGTGDLMLYDLCEQRIVRTQGEVILIVFGTEGSSSPFLSSAPRGISLMNMSGDGDSGTTHFILRAHEEDE
jgi:hypothetical protein